MFLIIKIYLLHFCGTLNNLVHKVLEVPNLWYSLKQLFLKHKRTSRKILSKTESCKINFKAEDLEHN